jgi:hypothetical protein
MQNRRDGYSVNKEHCVTSIMEVGFAMYLWITWRKDQHTRYPGKASEDQSGVLERTWETIDIRNINS